MGGYYIEEEIHDMETSEIVEELNAAIKRAYTAERRIAELEAENERLRDVMKLAAASARQIGHDERFTGHSVASGIEKALLGKSDGTD